jgi:hypothetical protein
VHENLASGICHVNGGECHRAVENIRHEQVVFDVILPVVAADKDVLDGRTIP